DDAGAPADVARDRGSTRAAAPALAAIHSQRGRDDGHVAWGMASASDRTNVVVLRGCPRDLAGASASARCKRAYAKRDPQDVARRLTRARPCDRSARREAYRDSDVQPK